MAKWYVVYMCQNNEISNFVVCCQAFIEYLLWKYKKSPEEIANAAQGENKEALEAAQRQIDEVQAALNDVLQKLEAQKQALAEQEQALADQKRLVAEVEAAVIEARAALEAQKKALAETQAAKAKNEEKLVQQQVCVCMCVGDITLCVCMLTLW